MSDMCGQEERRIGIPDHRPTLKKPNVPLPSTDPFPFDELPSHIQENIMHKALEPLRPKERLRLALVGSAWRKEARDTIKQIHMGDFPRRFHMRMVPNVRCDALDDFFDLLSGLSKTLETLGIPENVLAYGLHWNKWAGLPTMANVKSLFMCVRCEEITRLSDALQKFPGAYSLDMDYDNRGSQAPTSPFPANLPSIYRKLKISAFHPQWSGLLGLLTRQSNLNWLDLRHSPNVIDSSLLVPALNALRDSLTTLRLGALGGAGGSDLSVALKHAVNLVFLGLEQSVHDNTTGDLVLKSVKMLGNLQALHLRSFECTSDALQQLFLDPDMQLKRVVLTQCMGVDHLAIDALLTGNPGLEGISLQILAYSAPEHPDTRLIGWRRWRRLGQLPLGLDISAKDWTFAFRKLGLLKELRILRVLVDLGTQTDPLPTDFLAGLRSADQPKLQYAGVVQWDWRAKGLSMFLNGHDSTKWPVAPAGEWSPPATMAMVRMGDQLCQADWIVLPERQHRVRDGIHALVGNHEITIPLEESDAHCIKAFYNGMTSSTWGC